MPSEFEDTEAVKHAILKLLKDEDDGRTGRRFVFPKNVNGSYNIILGLNAKDALKYLLPVVIIDFVILLIPPYSSTFFWIIKILVMAFIFIVGLLIALYRPIASRPNIRSIEYLKIVIDYMNRQKVYFSRPKKYGGMSIGKQKQSK